jgi:DNA replication licensing factor MCM3
LSNTITEKDAQVAEEILRFALFKEVLKREKRKKRKLNNGRSSQAVEGSDSEDESDADGEEEVADSLMDQSPALEPVQELEAPEKGVSGEKAAESVESDRISAQRY